MSKEPTVADVMVKTVLVVNQNVTASECAKSMAKRGVSCAVVVEGTNAIGIVTERDLVSKVLADALESTKVLARDIMSTPLITVAPEMPLSSAAGMMAEYRVRRLVVIDGSGALAGIITTGDVARSIAQSQGYRDATFNAIARYKEGAEGGPYQ